MEIRVGVLLQKIANEKNSGSRMDDWIVKATQEKTKKQNTVHAESRLGSAKIFFVGCWHQHYRSDEWVEPLMKLTDTVLFVIVELISHLESLGRL